MQDIAPVILATMKIHNHIEESEYVKLHEKDWERIFEAITKSGDLWKLEERINRIIPLVKDIEKMRKEEGQ